MDFKNYVVVEYYFPKEGNFDDVMAISKKSLNTLKAGVGGLQMAQILQPVSKKGPIGMLTIWESQELFNEMYQNMDDSLKSEVKKVQELTSDIQVQMFTGFDGWHIS